MSRTRCRSLFPTPVVVVASPSQGLMSEQSLLVAFSEADEKGAGQLDSAGLGRAVRHLGLAGAKKEQFCKLLADKLQQKAKESEGVLSPRKKRRGESGSPLLSFPEWYDIVTSMHVTDGLGSVHNYFTGLIITLAVRSENQVGRASPPCFPFRFPFPPPSLG